MDRKTRSTLPAYPKETIVERLVTFTLNMNGNVFVIENVPASVVLQTGEELFSPETVTRIQELIGGEQEPIRVMETPVFDFA